MIADNSPTKLPSLRTGKNCSISSAFVHSLSHTVPGRKKGVVDGDESDVDKFIEGKAGSAASKDD